MDIDSPSPSFKENVPLEREKWVIVIRNGILTEHRRRTMTNDRTSEPASKKRKLDPSGSQPQSQSSFADVLQKLQEDAGEDARMSLTM
jgi:hypothetical protein